MKRQTLIHAMVVILAGLFVLSCIAVWMTRAHPRCVQWKLRLGGIILFLSAALAGVGSAGCTQVTCYVTMDEDRANEQACLEFLKQGNLDGAEAECALCLKRAKYNVECINATGMIHHQRGEHVHAEEWYRRAMRANNNQPEPRNNLCVLRQEQQPPLLDEAIQLCRSAIALDPGYADARFNLARALVRKGNAAIENPGTRGATLPASADESWSQAEEQAGKLLDMWPHYHKSLLLLAHIGLQRSIHSTSADERNQHIQHGLRAVEQWWKQAPSNAESSTEAAVLLGMFHHLAGSHEHSLQYWGLCLAMEPGNKDCGQRYHMASGLVANVHPELKEPLQRIAEDPWNAVHYAHLCSAAMTLGLPRIGAPACLQAAMRDRGACSAWMQLAPDHREQASNGRELLACQELHRNPPCP